MNVLLVDDHMDTRAVYAAVIMNLGHRVEAVPTVAAAVAAAQRQPFDLLVSDIVLSDGIGYDLMSDFSRRYRMRGIALTGLRASKDFQRSRAAGFSHHLVKPVDLKVLCDIVQSLAPAPAPDVAVEAAEPVANPA